MNVTPPETIEKFGQAYNVYHRETLYQEVWTMPVTEVAKRYKVSDVAIHKVCKSLDIPTRKETAPPARKRTDKTGDTDRDQPPGQSPKDHSISGISA